MRDGGKSIGIADMDKLAQVYSYSCSVPLYASITLCIGFRDLSHSVTCLLICPTSKGWWSMKFKNTVREFPQRGL